MLKDEQQTKENNFLEQLIKSYDLHCIINQEEPSKNKAYDFIAKNSLPTFQIIFTHESITNFINIKFKELEQMSQQETITELKSQTDIEQRQLSEVRYQLDNLYIKYDKSGTSLKFESYLSLSKEGKNIPKHIVDMYLKELETIISQGDKELISQLYDEYSHLYSDLECSFLEYANNILGGQHPDVVLSHEFYYDPNWSTDEMILRYQSEIENIYLGDEYKDYLEELDEFNLEADELDEYELDERGEFESFKQFIGSNFDRLLKTNFDKFLQDKEEEKQKIKDAELKVIAERDEQDTVDLVLKDAKLESTFTKIQAQILSGNKELSTLLATLYKEYLDSKGSLISSFEEWVNARVQIAKIKLGIEKEITNFQSIIGDTNVDEVSNTIKLGLDSNPDAKLTMLDIYLNQGLDLIEKESFVNWLLRIEDIPTKVALDILDKTQEDFNKIQNTKVPDSVVEKMELLVDSIEDHIENNENSTTVSDFQESPKQPYKQTLGSLINSYEENIDFDNKSGSLAKSEKSILKESNLDKNNGPSAYVRLKQAKDENIDIANVLFDILHKNYITVLPKRSFVGYVNDEFAQGTFNLDFLDKERGITITNVSDQIINDKVQVETSKVYSDVIEESPYAELKRLVDSGDKDANIIFNQLRLKYDTEKPNRSFVGFVNDLGKRLIENNETPISLFGQIIGILKLGPEDKSYEVSNFMMKEFDTLHYLHIITTKENVNLKDFINRFENDPQTVQNIAKKYYNSLK